MMMGNNSKDSLVLENSEHTGENVKNLDLRKIDGICFWDTNKELKKHNNSGEKPGTLISSEINEATHCLLETRIITIDGIDIKYVISITKEGKGKVNDCQVKDSYKIDNLDIINKFIEVVIFSYPDLVNDRKVKFSLKKSKKELVKESYTWERLAHNYVYYLVEKGDFDEFVKEHPSLKKILYRIRDGVGHVDLDIESLLMQSVYVFLGKIYLLVLKNKQ